MSLQAAKMTPPADGTMPPVVLAKRRWGAPMNQPIQNWQGRRVWLVGASSGIGLACAKALQAAGAHVHVSARDLGTLSEWAAACRAEGLPVELMSLDVTDALQVNMWPGSCCRWPFGFRFVLCRTLPCTASN